MSMLGIATKFDEEICDKTTNQKGEKEDEID